MIKENNYFLFTSSIGMTKQKTELGLTKKNHKVIKRFWFSIYFYLFYLFISILPSYIYSINFANTTTRFVLDPVSLPSSYWWILEEGRGGEVCSQPSLSSVVAMKINRGSRCAF